MMIGPAPMISTLSMSVRFGMIVKLLCGPSAVLCPRSALAVLHLYYLGPRCVPPCIRPCSRRFPTTPFIRTHLGMSGLEVARPDPRHDRMLLGQRDRPRDARAIGVDPCASRPPAGKHCGVHVERADFLAQQVRPGIERLLEDCPVGLQALDTPVLELGAGCVAF